MRPQPATTGLHERHSNRARTGRSRSSSSTRRHARVRRGIADGGCEETLDARCGTRSARRARSRSRPSPPCRRAQGHAHAGLAMATDGGPAVAAASPVRSSHSGASSPWSSRHRARRDRFGRLLADGDDDVQPSGRPRFGVLGHPRHQRGGADPGDPHARAGIQLHLVRHRADRSARSVRGLSPSVAGSGPIRRQPDRRGRGTAEPGCDAHVDRAVGRRLGGVGCCGGAVRPAR